MYLEEAEPLCREYNDLAKLSVTQFNDINLLKLFGILYLKIGIFIHATIILHAKKNITVNEKIK